MSIVLREGLGRPLTYEELDENFRTVAQVGDTASVAAVAATDAAAQAVRSANSAAASAAAAGGKVSLTGNETVAGVKTFTSSPLVPTPPVSDSSTRAQTTAGALLQIKSTGYALSPTERAPVAEDANLAIMPGLYAMAGAALNKPGSVRGMLSVGKSFEVGIYQSFQRATTSAFETRSSDDGGVSWTAWDPKASSGTQAFSGPIRPGQYTLTTLPSAATYNGYEIDVTNATGGSKRCRSNGTVWQILNTTTTVS